MKNEEWRIENGEWRIKTMENGRRFIDIIQLKKGYDMDINSTLLYTLFKDLISFLNKKDIFSIFNRLAKENFKVLKRETDYIIYADGTIILHIAYKVKILRKSDFFIEKYYECVNERTELKIDKIYKSFSDIKNKKINRFKNHLLVIELSTPINRKESVFNCDVQKIYKNGKSNKNRIEYSISYSNLERGDEFEFSISLTVPKEFSIENNKLSVKEDKIIIDHPYEKYVFRTKIDKQHPLSDKFSPICLLGNKRQKPTACDNIYYKCFEWKFKKPQKGEIIIKFN